MRGRDRIGACGLVVALVLGRAAASSAFPGGIASTDFDGTGCALCHSGGTVPTVVLSGPTSVPPGSTAEYTLTIFSNSVQNFGGLNVAAPAGVLSTGGYFAIGTQTITGLLGLTEITHSAPKQGDFLNEIDFSFLWTAPDDFTTVTLRGWGNAVNHDGLRTGDAASLATLDISSSAPGATATASSTPTSTPTPFVCGDAAPLQPPLVTAAAAQACQAASAKAGALYVKKHRKAVQACLKAFQAGAMSGDPIALCVGSATVAPSAATTAAAIAKAQGKVVGVLAAKCPDAALAGLGACAATESGLETCFLAQHRQAVVDAIASESGVVAQTSDKSPRRCQSAIDGAAGGYLSAHLQAGQKCLAKRNKAGSPVDGAALCVGSVVDGAFVPPTDAKAAAAVGAAQAKLAKAVQTKCDDVDIAQLNGCGVDQASALACLLCTHRATVFGLVSDEFGGAP